MPRLSRVLTHRRNAAALALLGIMSLGRAGIVWLDRLDDADTPARAIPYEVWPIELRLALWLAAGIVALVTAWTPWRRIGWVAVVIMPVQRAASHAWSAWHYYVPGYPPGTAESLASACYWLATVGLILLLAGWADMGGDEPEVR